MSELTLGADGLQRCGWVSAAPEFVEYHDSEWGYPVADDLRLFEKLCLEGFQAGLSWRTILAKRENFRAAFAGFDPAELAKFDGRDVERLLQDPGIVRHRGKIEAVLNNAERALELIDREGSLAAFVWSFEPPRDSRPTVRATAPESVALSKELRRRGWKFVGPTTLYAFMQAMGLVNDHSEGCAARAEAISARLRFVPPSA